MIALSIIVILFLILLFISFGIDVEYDYGTLRASAKVGPFKVTLLPRKEPAKPKAEKKRKEKKPEEEKEVAEKEKKAIPKDLIKAVIPMAGHTLNRVRRRLSIDIIAFHYTAAGDPYTAALNMGKASAAVGALYPAINKAFKVRKWDIATNVDFLADSPAYYVRFAGSFMTWELLYIVFALGVEFLNYLYTNR